MTDLAVLLPSKPPASVRDFLAHVHVELCWLRGKNLGGTGRFATALQSRLVTTR
jgi:hypothetical protein